MSVYHYSPIYLLLFNPVLESTAQFTHPDFQTSFLDAYCIHCEAAMAASGLTSIVAGDGARN
jgi:hypothetical protein